MIRLGVVVPSSNTVVERVFGRLFCTEDVSVHYARFPLRHARATAGPGPEALFAAARLVADAGVAAIAYAGVSGAWGSRDDDHRFCARVRDELDVPACTATDATVEALRRLGVAACGLIKAGSRDLLERSIATLADRGLRCTGAVNLEAADNRGLADVAPERLMAAARAVSGDGAEAICVLGTNLAAAPLADRLETELGLPVVDSVLATAWMLSEVAGASPPTAGWGRLMTTRRKQVET